MLPKLIKKIHTTILRQRWVALCVIPTFYLLWKYPHNLIRHRTIDPPQYFTFKKSKLIYLVNSKVAYTAIINTCGNSEKREYSNIQDTSLGEKKDYLTPREKTYYGFTFVRNPFERLYSCYKSKYHSDKTKYHRIYMDFDFYLGGLLRKDPGFAGFVQKISRIPDWLADRHFKSQYALIYQESKKKIDFIGRYEHLVRDFEILRTQFNLEPLPHLNKSGNTATTWRDAYTPELIDVVAKRYHKDLEVWYPTAQQELMHYHTAQKSTSTPSDEVTKTAK